MSSKLEESRVDPFYLVSRPVGRPIALPGQPTSSLHVFFPPGIPTRAWHISTWSVQSNKNFEQLKALSLLISLWPAFY